VLRIREPQLARPFKAGNFAFACSLGVGPAALIAYALWASRGDKLLPDNPTFGSVPALAFSIAVALLGPVLYWLTAIPIARRRLAAAQATD
jgi:hypothetical protein